jgi:hypothetical protein
MPLLPTLRSIWPPFAALALAVCLLPGAARAADPPMAVEFGVPYQMRVLAGRSVLEVYGSFSPGLAADFQAVIAHEPGLRVVHFESPGGHVLAAMQIATMIEQRGLDTYVGRMCASACTLAFLGGRQRWLAPSAKLGFHQARAERGSNELANKYVRQAYEKFGMPEGFIAHVLRTPPSDLWVPSQAELRAVHYTTDDPPAPMVATAGSEAPRLGDAKTLLRTAPNDALVQFAAALADALARLQEMKPEACFSFAHEGHGNELAALPRNDLEPIEAAMKYLADSSRYQQVPPLDAEQQRQASQDLFVFMRTHGQAAVLEGLRPGADHAAFCPALQAMLKTALAMPGPRQPTALRALLSGS